MRGVSLIVAAAFTISIQDVIFKLFSSQLTLWQIFALRGLLAVPMLIAVSWWRREHRGIFRMALGKWPLLRSIFITMTFLAFYAAIPFLSLSTVGAANYIAPVFVALLSAYVVREAIALPGWIGVLLGFSGVLVLLQPGTDAFSPWTILPVAGAFFYALAHMTTRTKCQNISIAAMSLSLNLVMPSVGLIVSMLLVWVHPPVEFIQAYPYIFGAWSALNPADWLVLTLLAGFAIIIGMLLAGAYQAAPSPMISTFEYSYLVFAAIWDILFFGIAPTATSVTGMVLIVIAGLLVLQRKSNNS